MRLKKITIITLAVSMIFSIISTSCGSKNEAAVNVENEMKNNGVGNGNGINDNELKMGNNDNKNSNNKNNNNHKDFLSNNTFILNLGDLEDKVGNFFDKEKKAAEEIAANDDGTVKYKASTLFTYSLDGGKTWVERLMEFDVNSAYYTSIAIQASQSKVTDVEQPVPVKIAIPMTKLSDVHITEGCNITDNFDAINNISYYDFNVVSDVNPEVFVTTFKCTPMKTGEVEMKVTYDKPVSSNWNKSVTVEYINSTH